MKILVLVKETITTDAVMHINKDGKVASLDETYIINPFDEFAIEEAIRIKERFGGEVVLISAGRREASYILRSGLAMGCDRGILMVTSEKETHSICDILKEAILREQNFDLILAGWVSSDYNNAQVTGRLSEALNIPLVTLVTNLEIKLDQNTVISEREGDLFLESVETKLPSIIAVQKGINQPRFPKLIDIVEVKHKKIDTITSAHKTKFHVSTPTYSLPPKKKQQIIVDGSDPEKAVHRLIKELKGAKLL
ncbi:MAG: electron transfer flavoprotein subunit beta/FixA family protein [Clostridia bacterium]|nr:electron transfer flavoprotein subunit beta/FixA family protein [Clostridia bacterium]